MQSRNPRVVAVYCQGYGDSVMALPALRAIDHFYQGQWQLICHDAVGDLLFHELECTLIKTKFTTESSRKRFDAVSVAANIGTCDLLISLVPWYSPDIEWLEKELKPSKTIGFFPIFNQWVPLDFSCHTAKLTFEIAKILDGDLRFETFSGRPSLPAHAIASVEKILGNFPTDMQVMVVHADTLAEKMWPMERFEWVLNQFLRRHSNYLSFILGTQPHSWHSGSESYRIIPCYGLTLDVSMGMVSFADMFLGIDSCMLHVADFFRVPGVGLYGATNPDEFGFLLGPHRHVVAETMAAIKSKTVLDTLENLCRQIA